MSRGATDPDFASLPPMSLYVHIPWCLAKCPYCDFNSHVRARGTLPERRYVEALLADLERELPLVWGRPVESMFFGGGTPSLLTPEILERLISELRARLPIVPDAEITLEANPGAADRACFRAYRQAGVNRLSLGVQSFQDRLLAAIGRIHDGRAAREALMAIRDGGFENFNIDLIFALPGQDTDTALRDVEEALSFCPPHLSLYQLSLEPGTRFGREPPGGLPDADAAAEMEDTLRARLAAAGLSRYEVSAHARQGAVCRHNRNYWLYGDYIGIGAGAHGKITLPDRILRTEKPSQPETYMDSALDTERSLGRSHAVTAEERPFEFMLNALRLTEGFPAALFAERTGLPLATIAGTLAAAEADGLLDRDALRIRPTARGLAFHNTLCTRFLPHGERRTIALHPA